MAHAQSVIKHVGGWHGLVYRLGELGGEWIQDGMVRAGRRGKNDKDIVDKINILIAGR